MPIKARITGDAARADIKRKAKGRHPLLQRLDGPHLAVWQTIVQDGNPKGGMTAYQMRQATHMFHPQVLADLVASLLVAKIGRNGNNEIKYVADEKGRGAFIQTVTVHVEMYEDENGKFFTKTTIPGSDNVAGKIVRKVGERRIHMRVPMLEEKLHEDIPSIEQPVLGDTKATAKPVIVSMDAINSPGSCVIEG